MKERLSQQPTLLPFSARVVDRAISEIKSEPEKTFHDSFQQLMRAGRIRTVAELMLLSLPEDVKFSYEIGVVRAFGLFKSQEKESGLSLPLISTLQAEPILRDITDEASRYKGERVDDFFSDLVDKLTEKDKNYVRGIKNIRKIYPVGLRFGINQAMFEFYRIVENAIEIEEMKKMLEE